MLSLYASRESNEILLGCPFPQFARITKFSEAVSLSSHENHENFEVFQKANRILAALACTVLNTLVVNFLPWLLIKLSGRRVNIAFNSHRNL